MIRDDEYKPRFPAGYRPGVGIIGCGSVVKYGHLPAYRKYGVRVVGGYDISPEATRGIEELGVERVFDDLDELLAEPRIEVVDVATRPEDRAPIVRRALEAGKHVLSQKPFAVDLAEARAMVEEAERKGLRLAVNQNGRWAPAWRVATLLVERGAIGDVVAVTHLYDASFDGVLGTHYAQMDHFLIYDFSVHFLDIARCWLASKDAVAVRAREYRTPNQPEECRTPLGAWIDVEYADGSSALVRSIGGNKGRSSCPFWIHGSEGTIRGAVLGRQEAVELDQGRTCTSFALEGTWIPDGFAGTMGELQCAIAEDREPYNSARHNLLSLAMTLAAVRSAEEGSRAVALEEVRQG